jgi:hypothetical protein
MFYLIDKVFGLRVSPAVERAGIDLAYHGIGSYPEFVNIEETFYPSLDGDTDTVPAAAD